jgi:hypothetical protein
MGQTTFLSSAWKKLHNLWFSIVYKVSHKPNLAGPFCRGDTVTEVYQLQKSTYPEWMDGGH